MQQNMTKDIVEMGFLDHLEELRWRIIKSIVAIVIGAIISFIYIIEVILKFFDEIPSMSDRQSK